MNMHVFHIMVSIFRSSLLLLKMQLQNNNINILHCFIRFVRRMNGVRRSSLGFFVQNLSSGVINGFSSF